MANSTDTPTTSDLTRQEIVARLAQEEDGTRGIHGDHGHVDVVTEREVVKVAHVESFREAMGDVLCQWTEFSSLKPRVHLYGRSSLGMYALAIAALSRNYIRCTVEPAMVEPDSVV